MAVAMVLTEKRKFIRHPLDHPLHFQPLGGDEGRSTGRSKDLSVGGIAFFCRHAPPQGARIRLTIPLPGRPFQEEGVVVRCRRVEDRWEVGVAFSDRRTWFRVRMVEQICRIEKYRRQQQEGGRELDFQAAAQEWIESRGDDFGRLYPG